jgi:hypothetical protein
MASVPSLDRFQAQAIWEMSDQDAQQSIGMDRSSSLEEAFLSTVESGTPSVASMSILLSQVFHRLGHLLYRAARPWDPSELVQRKASAKSADFRLNGKHRLSGGLQSWSSMQPAVNARRRAIAAISEGDGENRFFDPAEYLQYVLNRIGTGEPAEQFVPRMLRGKAHGDLHGRNILVGIVGAQAHWPAIFDHENMADDNLLAWDFVN